MFNSRNVRDAVTAKLAVLKKVDEAIIHDLYARAIFDELRNAHLATRNMQQAMVACVRVRQSENKWCMIDAAEWIELGKSIDVLAGQFKL